MKKLNYSVVASGLALLAVLLVTFAQYSRVLPNQQDQYLYFRAYFFIVTLGFLIYFMNRPASDLSGGLFTFHVISYCIVMMWFMPLYEASYFQCAIGTAFFRFRRNWIHPSICFIGLLAMFITYSLQDQMHWQLPVATRQDWSAIITIFFMLTWAIQKFAISSYSRDADNLRRFGVIGRDAARFTHDLKGLLSSPMLLLETFKDKNCKMPEEFYERQMALLIQDMEHVKETIRGINRLAIVDESIQKVDVNQVLKSVSGLLERRLKNIQIVFPENKMVLGNSERLHSIFFNLFINSLQAFETGKTGGGSRIEICWQRNTLVFKDNAGGMSGKLTEGSSGLGLELIKIDVQMMGGEFNIYSEGLHTFAEMKFGKKSIIQVNNSILSHE